MSTGKEAQWKSTWGMLGGLQVVLFELMFKGFAGVSPGKKEEKDRQSRGMSSRYLTQHFHYQANFS